MVFYRKMLTCPKMISWVTSCRICILRSESLLMQKPSLSLLFLSEILFYQRSNQFPVSLRKQAIWALPPLSLWKKRSLLDHPWIHSPSNPRFQRYHENDYFLLTIHYKVLKYFCLPLLKTQESPSAAGYKAKVIKPPPSEQPLKSFGQRPRPTSPAPPVEKPKAKVEEAKEEEGTEDWWCTRLLQVLICIYFY